MDDFLCSAMMDLITHVILGFWYVGRARMRNLLLNQPGRRSYLKYAGARMRSVFKY